MSSFGRRTRHNGNLVDKSRNQRLFSYHDHDYDYWHAHTLRRCDLKQTVTMIFLLQSAVHVAPILLGFSRHSWDICPTKCRTLSSPSKKNLREESRSWLSKKNQVLLCAKSHMDMHPCKSFLFDENGIALLRKGLGNGETELDPGPQLTGKLSNAWLPSPVRTKPSLTWGQPMAASCWWQTELTFHCDSFGVINPLSTTASNQ